jgi:hypothetical protein
VAVLLGNGDAHSNNRWCIRLTRPMVLRPRT